MKLFYIDLVCFLKHFDLFRCNVAEDTDAKTRARKRMTLEDHFRNSKIAPNRANLVLEEFAKGLDQLEVHLVRQPADVVMRFYRHRRPAKAYRFDQVRVQRALHEPL